MLDIQLAEGEQVMDNELIFNATKRPVIHDDFVDWQYQVERTTRQEVNINEIRKKLVGRGTDEIIAILASQGLESDQVTYHVFPAWWKRVPFLESRIEVGLNE